MPGSGNSEDLEVGAVSEHPNSLQPQMSSSSSVSEHPNSAEPRISSPSTVSDQLSPLRSLQNLRQRRQAPLPTSSPSLQNSRRQDPLNWDSVGLAVITIQLAWIVSLVQVALVKELATPWLRLPLIGVFFLITFALVLSLVWLLFSLCLGTDNSRRNYIMGISLLITAFAAVITRGACICHLLRL